MTLSPFKLLNYGNDNQSSTFTIINPWLDSSTVVLSATLREKEQEFNRANILFHTAKFAQADVRPRVRRGLSADRYVRKMASVCVCVVQPKDLKATS